MKILCPNYFPARSCTAGDFEWIDSLREMEITKAEAQQSRGGSYRPGKSNGVHTGRSFD